MKSHLNRTTLIFGSIILTLMVVDGLIQLQSVQGYTFDMFQHVRPNSAVAVFLIGLTLGMAGGIAVFFAQLKMREESVDEGTRELDLLLEEIALTEDDDFSIFEDDSMVDEKAELSDPWERPADWWMNADED